MSSFQVKPDERTFVAYGSAALEVAAKFLGTDKELPKALRRMDVMQLKAAHPTVDEEVLQQCFNDLEGMLLVKTDFRVWRATPRHLVTDLQILLSSKTIFRRDIGKKPLKAATRQALPYTDGLLLVSSVMRKCNAYHIAMGAVLHAIESKENDVTANTIAKKLGVQDNAQVKLVRHTLREFDKITQRGARE